VKGLVLRLLPPSNMGGAVMSRSALPASAVASAVISFGVVTWLFWPAVETGHRVAWRRIFSSFSGRAPGQQCRDQSEICGSEEDSMAREHADAESCQGLTSEENRFEVADKPQRSVPGAAWACLDRLKSEVQRAKRQVHAASGGIGLLPDGRPKLPRAPDGRLVDARLVFKLDTLLARAAECAENAAWRDLHPKSLHSVATEMEQLGDPAPRARVFCMCVRRAGCEDPQSVNSSLYGLLPILGEDHLASLLGLPHASLGQEVTSQLLQNPQALRSIHLAVENLVSIPWDDADDADCFAGRKWESFRV